MNEPERSSRRRGPLRRATRALRLPAHRAGALRRLAELHARPRSLEEIVDAALDLGSRGLLRIRASQRRPEILALARAVAALAPRNVLEIGTHLGGTLLVWSQLASRRVVSCDLNVPWYRRGVYGRFVPPGSACQVLPLAGDSHDAAFRARVEAAFGGEPVDFLFLDGDHSEAGVERDYRDYAPLVRPGGIIAFHDIVPRQPEPASRVGAFWLRLRREVATEELVEDPGQCGYGIGIVRVAPTSGA